MPGKYSAAWRNHNFLNHIKTTIGSQANSQQANAIFQWAGKRIWHAIPAIKIRVSRIAGNLLQGLSIGDS